MMICTDKTIKNILFQIFQIKRSLNTLYLFKFFLYGSATLLVRRPFAGKLSQLWAGPEYCKCFYYEKLLKHDILKKFVLSVNVFSLKKIARYDINFINIFIS